MVCDEPLMCDVPVSLSVCYHCIWESFEGNQIASEEEKSAVAVVICCLFAEIAKPKGVKVPGLVKSFEWVCDGVDSQW